MDDRAHTLRKGLGLPEAAAGDIPPHLAGRRKVLSERLQSTSLKNKIFFSTTVVILLISLLIALFTRWVLISSLTSELKQRGMGIARSIAESSRGFILTADVPRLTSLLFEARLGERKFLINYVFVLDKDAQILAHTFTRPFPAELYRANSLGEDQTGRIKLLRHGDTVVYDIAVPVQEGIYQIGTVHVGLYKKHIDLLIGKLRTTFLGFVSVVIVLFFIISHLLSRYITRPISELTKLSDAISRGDFDIEPDLGEDFPCWEIQNCSRHDCPAYHNTEVPCWYVDETRNRNGRPKKFPDKLTDCYPCTVYKRGVRDEVRQLTNSFINMTHRIKISQAQLKESEEKYRSLFTSGPNPIFVLDQETLEILDANPSAEEIYGFTKSELLGRPFTDLGPFEVPSSGWDHAYDSAAHRSRVVSSKVQYFRKGNNPFYVNVHTCPARYRDRGAVIVATTDITEMVEKDNQLIQASKMKTLGEMSAGIAHELNQPLNAIKMGSEYLEMMVEREKEVPEGDLVQVVEEVSRQVDRATEILQRLRDFGRKSGYSRERIDVNQPIRAVLDILGKQLELQNIDVRLDLDSEVPAILAHPNRLEQVIFNLLTNARDALNMKGEAGEEGDGRYIGIRTFRHDGRAMVSVTDNGAGIPDAVKSNIFEAFFTTKEMGEGMGLGLSISNGIVEDYGGQIVLESREGEGSTFTLSFPAAV